MQTTPGIDSPDQVRRGEETRVVQIITRPNIGGPTRHVAVLNERLPMQGYRSTLLAGKSSPDEGTLTVGGEVIHLSVLRREVDLLQDIAAYRQIRRLIGRIRPQVVHTHMAKAGALGRLAAHRARTPVIVHTFHGHVLEGYFTRTRERAFLAVERYLARRTDALIAVSEVVRDELLAMGIGEPDRWHVIPLGEELDELLTLEKTAEMKASLGLDPARLVVGIVGRLAPIKNHDAFLALADRLTAMDPSIQFLVAGDGEERARLESEAHGLHGDVRFVGWVDDLPHLYGAIDVLVSTSRNEGTPGTVIEAAAASTPVVATNVGGLPEVVDDGTTGYLVPPGDEEALTDRVTKLLLDPHKRAAFGEAARRRARERFLAGRLVQDIDRLYKRLLEEKKP